jgi:hypothetical protein
MVSEADEDSTDTKKRASTRPKKKRTKPPIPQTEAEIDAPDRLTLVVLGFMGVVTLVLWGFARGACNYHPPRETRRPRPVKLEELAREPKSAAMEMQQRFLMYDYAGAAELATGEALAAVEKAKAECAAKAQACAMERKNREKHVQSSPALLERGPTTAVVRITSEVLGKKEVNLLKLERTEKMWKVSSRGPDDPSFKPEPQEPPAMMMGHPPIPGSAGPAGSGAAIPMPAGSGTTRTFTIRPPGAGPVPPPAPPAPPPAAPAASK